MWSAALPAMVVLTVVVIVLVIQDATQFTPDRRLARNATRVGAVVVLLWLALRLIRTIRTHPTPLGVLLSRAFVDGAVAILVCGWRFATSSERGRGFSSGTSCLAGFFACFL